MIADKIKKAFKMGSSYIIYKPDGTVWFETWSQRNVAIAKSHGLKVTPTLEYLCGLNKVLQYQNESIYPDTNPRTD